MTRISKTMLISLGLSLALTANADEEVTLDTLTGPLSGTLVKVDAPIASVLIIAGSGPTDRDGNVAGLPGSNNSLKYVAEALRDQNIASLRFDKRMIGKSVTPGLAESDLRFDTYVNDALAWSDWLAKRVDAPTFLLGHSEGALIALVAAKDRDVAGVLALAGLGRPASDAILSQTKTQLPPALYSQTQDIVAQLKQGETVDETPPMLAALFRPSVQPYLISWFAYDPAIEIAAVEAPVLLVHGTTDLQVPVSDGELLQSARPDAELIVIDGMNHVLKAVDGGPATQMPSYGNPDLPLAPNLSDGLTRFILKHSLSDPTH